MWSDETYERLRIFMLKSLEDMPQNCMMCDAICVTCFPPSSRCEKCRKTGRMLISRYYCLVVKKHVHYSILSKMCTETDHLKKLLEVL